MNTLTHILMECKSHYKSIILGRPKSGLVDQGDYQQIISKFSPLIETVDNISISHTYIMCNRIIGTLQIL